MKTLKTMTAAALVLTTAAGHAAGEYADIDSLSAVHGPLLWICAFVALAVLTTIVFSVARFRHADAVAAQAFEKRRAREFVWALLPMAIVIAAAAPAIRESSPQAMQAHRTGIRDLVAHVDHTRLPVAGNLDAQAATVSR
ncbi:MAG TPA: cytochrome c oxidase subunit II transmembrane domain-containing protein [Steroidobacteraceae bacterium]|nr:cytochrome c oxidase subunit II transmembrane domain-containing protein [Steroidobacteraceae bacterium]